MKMDKNKGRKSIIIIAAILCAAAFLVLLIVGASCDDDTVQTGSQAVSTSQTTKQTTQKKEKITATAYKIVQDFKKNETVAAKKYKGKVLTVTEAKVHKVDGNKVELQYISDDDYDFNFVENFVCYYNEDSKSAVKKLKTGDEIKVTGDCEGLSYSRIKMKNCKFS